MPEAKKTALDLFIMEKVKSMRQSKNMSQAVLAIKLGVSDAFIGQIENPKHRAKYNLEHVYKLTFIFECSPGDLFPKNQIL